MNVIVGILIGIANDTWMGRIMVPFIWGISWYLRVIFFKREYYEKYLEESRGKSLKWGMKPKVAFFFVEYMTALSTSLVFSVIAGFIYDLIKK